jgi:spoIIIJ-associated protein
MSEMNNIIEARGEDVDSAIQAGLEQLELSRDDVIVEVVEEGSRGFLGLGSRPAVVRLQAKEKSTMRSAAPTTGIRPAAPVTAETGHKAPLTEQLPEAERLPLPELRPDVTEEDEDELEETSKALVTEEDQQAEIDVAQEITRGLLQRLQIQASVTARLSEPDDLTGQRLPIIDIRGRDLAVLIGPQGETLNSFQYVARLMAGHALQRRANFIIDVESYRERRKQALARLAERMAGKVIQGGRPVTLEPMPANERRIIHVTLRDHLQVYTQSVGEGRRRQVCIFPKQET